MKNLFQNLDLYKVIILASLVLLPAVGFWAYRLNGEIELGRVAIRNALKDSGDLEEIGKYEKAVEEQKRNTDKEEGQESYSVYFQKHIVHGASRLRRVNFEIGVPQENQVRGKAIDTVVPMTSTATNAPTINHSISTSASSRSGAYRSKRSAEFVPTPTSCRYRCPRLPSEL